VVFRSAQDLDLESAKKATKNIIDVIVDFLNSVEAVFPNSGYGDLSKNMCYLRNDVNNCKGPFLDLSQIDRYIGSLLDAFTRMNPDIEKNLRDLYDAYVEVSDFLVNNNTNIDFKLLDFDPHKVTKMRNNVFDSNLILFTLKQENYRDKVALRALFSSFSSVVETTEKSFLDELLKYRDRINQFAINNQIQYIFPHDPVSIFGIEGKIQRTNGKYYTKPRALRHLINHDHVTINQNNGSMNIHFQSPSDPSWEFQFDEKYTVEEFFDYYANVDLFYKTAVCLMFSLMLNAVLKTCFKS